MSAEKMPNKDKEEKLYEAIKDLLPSKVAMALAKSSGAGSGDEIRFLVGLVCEFKNIAFHRYVNGDEIVLSAQYSEDDAYKNYYLRFSFQHVVKNAAPKSPDWRVDMAVFVYANYPIEAQRIGAMAYEYDGHPSHYIETGIKKQMVRDAHILDQEILHVQRVSSEGAKSDPGLYKKALRKYVRHCIDTHKKTVEGTTNRLINTAFTIDQDHTVRQRVTPTNSIDRFVDCPVCKAHGYFGPIQCDLCKGNGTLRRRETMRSDLPSFFEVRCLACLPGPARTSCRHCDGSGTMDNIKALEYAKKHETFESRWK